MGEYNWKDFFEQSDRFIQEWSESPEECARNSVYLQEASGGEKSFLYEDKDFMPEPFLGNPERCSAVMLTLNPAAPMDKFRVDKNYAKKIISDGYSERAQKWTIFEENDGGFIWWAKRENWLNRILGNEDTTLKPFAIDICPWHSKSWGGLNYENELVEEIKKNVLAPAFNAVKNSLIPFAIAIGKDFYDVLTIKDENNEPYLGFTQKECVVAGCYNKQAEDLRVIKWPKNKNKEPVNKAFAIFENDNKDRILCIWCPDGGSNQPPQSGFDELVQNFVKKYKNNI